MSQVIQVPSLMPWNVWLWKFNIFHHHPHLIIGTTVRGVPWPSQVVIATHSYPEPPFFNFYSPMLSGAREYGRYARGNPGRGGRRRWASKKNPNVLKSSTTPKIHLSLDLPRPRFPPGSVLSILLVLLIFFFILITCPAYLSLLILIIRSLK